MRSRVKMLRRLAIEVIGVVEYLCIVRDLVIGVIMVMDYH